MKTIHVALICLLFTAFSCGSGAAYKDEAAPNSESTKDMIAGNAVMSEQEEDKSKETADSTSNNGFFSSSAARISKLDSTRKFIRTVDMKFKVESVQKSTYIIEDIIANHNGFVTLSDLHATINYTSRTAVSADSTLETTHYLTENSMSLRVPNVSLDSVLKEIAKQISFLDYRVIKAEDVSLQIMANKWSLKRAERHHDRLEKAIDSKGKKLREINEAEESLSGKEELADYNKINNLSLLDQVSYSTVNVRIYQRESVKNELIANDKDISAYEPGFGSKLLDSLSGGWYFLQDFVLFMIKIWPLYLIAALIWIILKRYFGKK